MMRQVIPPGSVVGPHVVLGGLGVFGVLGLLGALEHVVGLGVAGWAAGVAGGALLAGFVAVGPAWRTGPGLGPADRITLTRAVLGCGVAALAADGFTQPAPVALFGGLAAVALVLDAVDGWVARRTGTTSTFGARFDMEADAFLILALSVQVAREVGWWVLAAGVARYALALATWWAPWLRRHVPARRWRKVVAAVQGVVLAVAASHLIPPVLTVGLVAMSLFLLAASFSTQVRQLWRLRSSRTGVVARRSVRAARGAGPEPRGGGVQCPT